jgi:hypothetical protein
MMYRLYSPYRLTWQRSYDRTCGDDMAEFGWQLRSNDVSTHGSMFGGDWVPRGPVMGCHVAPQHWLIVNVKCIGVRGVRPPDLPTT